MIRAFLFDLDGTLLDSEILWVEATQRALAERGCAITHEEAMRLVYGRAWGDIRGEMYTTYAEALRDGEPIELQTDRIFKELQTKRDIRIPSSIDLLVRLGRTWPVAIVSGSTRRTIEECIALMNIEPYVRLYVGTEDYTAGKPDPSCFLLAAQLLDVPPASCLVFEDSAAGVRAAKAAAMTCVALQRPGRPAQDVTAADEVLADLAAFRVEKYVAGAADTA
jgi:beta-phosphoglucomutase-like phosphatase (HAD superfamily)